MGSERSYTDEENERLRAVVGQLVQRFGNQRRVADALEISQPALSAFLLGRYGFGPAVVRRIASLVGRTPDELLSGARGSIVAPARDEFPNREPVIEFAKRVGYSDAVVKKLRAARPSGRRDVPSTEWARLLVLFSSIADSPFEVDLAKGLRKAVEK